MGRYLLRRLGFALLLVFIVSSASLLLTQLAPGDITTETAIVLDPEARARLRAELGLDRPLLVQYASWLGGLARLDFGRSLLYSRPVSSLLGERALNTAVLATAALLLATLVGVPLGIYSGSRARGIGPAVVRIVSVVGLSVPPLIGSLEQGVYGSEQHLESCIEVLNHVHPPSRAPAASLSFSSFQFRCRHSEYNIGTS